MVRTMNNGKNNGTVDNGQWNKNIDIVSAHRTIRDKERDHETMRKRTKSWYVTELHLGKLGLLFEDIRGCAPGLVNQYSVYKNYYNITAMLDLIFLLTGTGLSNGSLREIRPRRSFSESGTTETLLILFLLLGRGGGVMPP